MSDVTQETTTEPEVDAPVPEPAEAVQEVDTPAEPDLFDDPATEQFPRAYVEKLRRENAASREKYQKFAKAFDGYTDEARDWTVNTLLPALAQDPEGTIRQLAQEFGITEAQAEQIVEDATAAEKNAEPQYLTREEARAEAERVVAEKEKEAEEKRVQQEAQDAIVDEAKQLGYDPKAEKGTPAHADFQYLLILARDAADGDLAKAHEMIEAARAQWIAEHVEKVAAENAGNVSPVRPGGVGVKPGEKPKTLEEARKASSAYFDAIGYKKQR